MSNSQEKLVFYALHNVTRETSQKIKCLLALKRIYNQGGDVMNVTHKEKEINALYIVAYGCYLIFAYLNKFFPVKYCQILGLDKVRIFWPCLKCSTLPCCKINE